MLENTDSSFAQLILKSGVLIEGASTNSPDIGREMLIQGAYLGGLELLVGAVMFIVGVFVVFTDGLGRIGLVSAVLILVGSCYTISSLSTLIKIEHAPKYYLLDKAAGYVGCK